MNRVSENYNQELIRGPPPLKSLEVSPPGNPDTKQNRNKSTEIIFAPAVFCFIYRKHIEY